MTKKKCLRGYERDIDLEGSFAVVASETSFVENSVISS